MACLPNAMGSPPKLIPTERAEAQGFPKNAPVAAAEGLQERGRSSSWMPVLLYQATLPRREPPDLNIDIYQDAISVMR
jgi:hypothetical protein